MEVVDWLIAGAKNFSPLQIIGLRIFNHTELDIIL